MASVLLLVILVGFVANFLARPPAWFANWSGGGETTEGYRRVLLRSRLGAIEVPDADWSPVLNPEYELDAEEELFLAHHWRPLSVEVGRFERVDDDLRTPQQVLEDFVRPGERRGQDLTEGEAFRIGDRRAWRRRVRADDNIECREVLVEDATTWLLLLACARDYSFSNHDEVLTHIANSLMLRSSTDAPFELAER